jgi:hypothetical protein
MTGDALLSVALRVGARVAVEADFPVARPLAVHAVARSAPEFSRRLLAATARGERFGVSIHTGATPWSAGGEYCDKLRQIRSWPKVLERFLRLGESNVSGKVALLADRIARTRGEPGGIHYMIALWIGRMRAAISVTTVAGDGRNAAQARDAVQRSGLGTRIARMTV